MSVELPTSIATRGEIAPRMVSTIHVASVPRGVVLVILAAVAVDEEGPALALMKRCRQHFASEFDRIAEGVVELGE